VVAVEVLVETLVHQQIKMQTQEDLVVVAVTLEQKELEIHLLLIQLKEQMEQMELEEVKVVAVVEHLQQLPDVQVVDKYQMQLLVLEQTMDQVEMVYLIQILDLLVLINRQTVVMAHLLELVVEVEEMVDQVL
jgi:hypothetical protein